MKFKPKQEYLVLLAVKELGLANVQEIEEFLREQFELTLDEAVIQRIISRWQAKSLLAIDYSEGKSWKMAKIPPPFASAKMIDVKSWRVKDFQKVLNEVDKEFPEAEQELGDRGKGRIGNYHTYDLMIETVDPILGGEPTGDSFQTILREPTEGKPVFKPAWFKGWIRDNGPLIGMNRNGESWMAYSMGMPVDEPKLTKKSAPVKARGRGAGITVYEAFEPGTKISVKMRVPLRGISIKGQKDIERLFKLCEVAPKRGFGANPYYYGGRVRLLEINEVED